jgi:hypothetical protein
VVIKVRRDDPQWSDRCCDPNERSMRRVRYRAFTGYQIAGVSMCVEVGGHRPEERVEVPFFVERHSCDARQITGKLLEGRQARRRIYRDGASLALSGCGCSLPLPTATRLMTDATSTVRGVPLVTDPDLDRFARLDSRGLTVTGHRSSATTRCCSARSRSPTTGVPAAASRGVGITRCGGGSRICHWGTGCGRMCDSRFRSGEFAH